MDFDAEGLLDDLTDAERSARLPLLRWLESEGASPAEMKAAAAEHRLALLPLERRLGGQFSAEEIEAATGLPAALMLYLRRLTGLPQALPGERAFGEYDVAMARSIQQFLDAGFDVETLSEMTRVLGESMARAASAAAAAFAETFLEPGDTEIDVARRFDALAQQLVPAMEPVLAGAFTAHLRESIHRAMLGADELNTGRLAASAPLTVCFADMVGFTRLGGELEVSELGSVASRLAALAGDHASGPVRLIKTIGDAAMFVSTEPAPLIGAALALIADAEAAELPTLRAGIAYGEAAARGGDYFGHSVNLASRATGSARPGTLLCTQEVRDSAAADFDWSYAGRFRLKGIAAPVALHRARAPRAE
jgi:adenylate cyclase